MNNPLFVGVSDDEGPIAAFENFLDHDYVADPLVPTSCDDVHGLVEHHFLAASQVFSADLRRDGHAQLAPGGEDVDGPVLEAFQEHAIAARRLGQPIDFFLQRHHLIASLAQSFSEALVALREAARASLRFGEAVFEQPKMTRRFRDFGAEQLNLLLEERGTATQFSIVGVLVRAVLIAWLGCHAVTSRLVVSSQLVTLHTRARDGGQLL